MDTTQTPATQWQNIDTAPKNGGAILTDEGTACYVDRRYWGSPVKTGWYLCNIRGDIPTCAEDGMAIAAINPKAWIPVPICPENF